MATTGFNEFDALSRVLVHPAAQAFSAERIAAEWRALNFSGAPDLARALDEYRSFQHLLTEMGADVVELPHSDGLTLDAIYTHDASTLSPRGMVLCRMGKAAREHEPQAHRRCFDALEIPVAGAIEPPGRLEGGDIVWFDAHTVAVGRGYRTNDAGIAQFTALVGPGVTVHVVPLPHYRGPEDVFHLMSIVSPVDETLAVVYSPLMPVPFRDWLLERGMRLVEVSPEEFDSMGANVLAVAPRRCVMVEGAPITRSRLEAEGAEVRTYSGSEISLKGGGGPTCLTRPLVRRT